MFFKRSVALLKAELVQFLGHPYWIITLQWLVSKLYTPLPVLCLTVCLQVSLKQRRVQGDLLSVWNVAAYSVNVPSRVVKPILCPCGGGRDVSEWIKRWQVYFQYIAWNLCVYVCVHVCACEWKGWWLKWTVALFKCLIMLVIQVVNAV